MSTCYRYGCDKPLGHLGGHRKPLYPEQERQSAHVGGSLARTPMLGLRCSQCGATTDDPKRLNAVCDACGDGVMVRGAMGVDDA